MARALHAALAARHPRGAEHGLRVARLAGDVGERLSLTGDALRLLMLAACLQEVGNLALPDSALAISGPLDAAEWDVLTAHAARGGDLLAQVPELAAAAPIVRAHHERWDGQGYPDGLRGDEIPFSGRVLAACDAAVAMQSARPYRSALDPETAVQHLLAAAGSQLDPRAAQAVSACLLGAPSAAAPPEGATSTDGPAGPPPPAERGRRGTRAPGRPAILRRLAEVKSFPALHGAQRRVLDRLDAASPSRADVVAIIERDAGLTLAILRAAPGAAGVPAAYDALTPRRVAAILSQAPAVDFLWPRDSAQAGLDRFRIHAVTTQRAAQRIADMTGYGDLDELAVSALLHDIGKHALERLVPGYPAAILADARTPDEQLKRERRQLKLDHAVVGSLLVRAWSLPDRLAGVVADHHTAEGSAEATIVRLADVLAHQSQGTAFPPATVLRLGYALDLSPTDLREILFELPHASGSKRVRSEPCPLSARELESVRGLAAGKTYEQIAAGLGLSASTVRSHLHNSYRKLGAADRAQAVLIATDRGWL